MIFYHKIIDEFYHSGKIEAAKDKPGIKFSIFMCAVLPIKFDKSFVF